MASTRVEDFRRNRGDVATTSAVLASCQHSFSENVSSISDITAAKYINEARKYATGGAHRSVSIRKGIGQVQSATLEA